jgi:hypothetical protein
MLVWRPAKPRRLTPVKKTELSEAIRTELVREIGSLLGDGVVHDLDLEALETAARQRSLEVTAGLVAAFLNQDHSDQTEFSLPCSCGQTARFVERRTKRFQGILGWLNLERAYYCCNGCGHGFCPRDRALGLEGASSTPALVRMVGVAASMVSFDESRELLDQLAGLRVNAKKVERVAETLGAEIAADEREFVEPLTAFPLPPTLYLGMDGTGTPMRPCELLGRGGKQPDGSSKTREAKLCIVWSAEGRDKEGIPQRDEGSFSCTAGIESAAASDSEKEFSEFAKRVEREVERRRFRQASRQAILGDGAAWIWNTADELFPGAIQILDRYHAKTHISDAAKAIWGADSEIGKQWAHERNHELDDGEIDKIQLALSPHTTGCEEARQCHGYIETNRKRMRYKDFREQGLCTSTGIVEAGCKNVVGARLKRSGMRWTLRGANAIIALRCCRHSGRFEDFWERRKASAA